METAEQFLAPGFEDCSFRGTNQVRQSTGGLWCLAFGSLDHLTLCILSPPALMKKSLP